MKKPWYRRWWGIAIIVWFGLVVIGAISDVLGDSPATDDVGERAEVSSPEDEPDITTETDIDRDPPAAASGSSSPHCKDVWYYVDGTAVSASITMTTGRGTEQANVGVPLRIEDRDEPGLRIGCMTSGTFVYISAQNRGESGSIECRIEADGEVISQANSRGAYVIAGCDASVP